MAAASTATITENSFAYEVLSLSLCQPRAAPSLFWSMAAIGHLRLCAIERLLRLRLCYTFAFIKEFNAGTTQSQPGKQLELLEWGKAPSTLADSLPLLVIIKQRALNSLRRFASLLPFCFLLPPFPRPLLGRSFSKQQLSAVSLTHFTFVFFISVSQKFTKKLRKSKKTFLFKENYEQPLWN